MDKKKKKTLLIVAVLLSAIVAGCIFDLTKASAFFKLKEYGLPYSDFVPGAPDPITFIAPQIRDLLDGHWLGSDGATYEYMHAPALWSTYYNAWLLFPLVALFGSLQYLYLVGYFIVGFFTFLIFYLIIKNITGNRYFSIFSSLVFTSAANIFYLIFPITLEQIKISVRTLTFLGSPPIHILTNKYDSVSVLPGLIPFSLTFLFTYLAITKGKKLYIALAGIFSGLLVYFFPTSAMYIWTALGIMMILFLLFKDHLVAKRIFWILMLAMLISSLFFFNFFALKSLPWSTDIFLRLGGEFGRTLRLGRHVFEYLLYVAFALLIWKTIKEKKTAIYLIGFALAPIFLLNIQLFGGYSPFATNWYYHQFYYGFALAWIAFAYTLYKWLEAKYPTRRKIVTGCFILLALIITARAVHVNIYRGIMDYPAHTIPKNISNSLEWMDKNIEKDAVVVSPSLFINFLVPVYTSGKVMYGDPMMFPGSSEELYDRWIIVHKLFNVSQDVFDGIINKDSLYLFGDYFSDTRIGSQFKKDPEYEKTAEKLIAEKLGDISKLYMAYPRNIHYLINKYKIDYLYFGAYKSEGIYDFIKNSSLEGEDWLIKVYDSDDIKIYKVIK